MKVAIALSVLIVAAAYALHGVTTGVNDIVPEVSLASAKQGHDNSVSTFHTSAQ